MSSSIFDIIGPVMIGPSSSHTAGAARLAKMARLILNDEPVVVEMTLYGSFAKTYKGHGTDRALVAGLLGFDAEDERIPEAFLWAKDAKLKYSFCTSENPSYHPNTVAFHMTGRSGKMVDVTGCSLGGGRIMVTEISHLPVEITGEGYTLMTVHRDQPGVIAYVTALLSKENINVSEMRVFRQEKFVKSVMIIGTDLPVPEHVRKEVENHENIVEVMAFDPL